MQPRTLVLLLGSLACCPGMAGAADSGSARAELLELGRLPLSFEANAGQFDRRVRFLVRGRNETAFVADEGLVLVRSGSKSAERVALRFRFEGAKWRGHPEGVEALPGHSNYLIGNLPRRWHTDVPHYARVVRHGAYRGIDVAYYQGRHGIEYDLIVAPGADPSQVRLAIEGADSVELAADGDLVLHTPLGDVRQHKPFVYQGERADPQVVDGSYRVIANGAATEVRFELGAYDRERALVLDPVLDFGTYFGGALDDTVNGIALDPQSNIYIAGSTSSDATTFPETVGAYQTAKAASSDAFVAKIKADRSGLDYATYVGGNSVDSAIAIAVDANGQAAIGGTTISTNYPTANAVQGTKPGTGNVGIVTKLNAAGNGLVFSTYLGGSTGAVRVFAIAADPSLNTYVTGPVQFATDFPTSAGAFQAALPSGSGSGTNTFVVKYAANGTRTYGTVLGANGEQGNGIAADAAGAAYVIGTTSTAGASINAVPFTTLGPGGFGDVLIAKLNANGTALAYLTRIGSSDVEEGVADTLDGAGNVYFTGRSFYGLAAGTNSDLPSTPAAPKNTNVALFGALNSAGTALTGPGLTWYGNATATTPCTSPAFLYGAYGASIALDPNANEAYVLGYGCPLTKFTEVNPIAGLSCSPNCNADTNHMNSFLVHYGWGAAAKSASPDAVDIPNPTTLSVTAIGGASGSATLAAGIAASTTGYVFTFTSDATLPTLNPLDASPNGGEDGVVYRLLFGLPPTITKQFSPSPIDPGGSSDLFITVTNPNNFTLKDVKIEDQLPPGLRLLPEIPTIPVETPVGCNRTLGLFGWDKVNAGLISNQYTQVQLGSTGPAKRDLPPSFTCTIRFRVTDVAGDVTSFQNTTSAPTSANTIPGTAAAATLNVNVPSAWSYVGGSGGSPYQLNIANNWSPASIPSMGSVVRFGVVLNTLKTVLQNINALYPFGLFQVTDSGYDISGSEMVIERELLVEQPFSLKNDVRFSDGSVLAVAAGADSTVSGKVTIPPGGVVTYFSDATLQLTGPLSSLGTIEIAGVGTVQLEGSAPPDNDGLGVIIGGGALQVDKNFKNLGPCDIGLNSELRGTGTVGPTTNGSGGAIRPGTAANPFGMLTVDQSYTSIADDSFAGFEASSQVMKAGAIGTSSQLMVTGPATLSGTLVVNFDGLPPAGTTYNLISATAVSGRFARIVETPKSVFGSLTYTGTGVTYTVNLTTGIFRDSFE